MARKSTRTPNRTVRVVLRRGTSTYDVFVDGVSAGTIRPLNGGWEARAPDGRRTPFPSGFAASRHLVGLAELRVANRARREHRDLVTGFPRRAGMPGAVPTGQYVMRMRPEPGDPFEVVTVEREDLDPSKDVYGVSKEAKAHYQAQAKKLAKARAKAEKERQRRLKRLAAGRVKGIRGTFDSPRQGAQQIYDENANFYGPVVEYADPIDYLDRWFDTNEVKVGKRYRPLLKTKRGRELYDAHRHISKDAVIQALAYVLGKTKSRRWDKVDWGSIEDYNDALRTAFQDQIERSGTQVPWDPSFEKPLAARGLPSEMEAAEAPEAIRRQYAQIEAQDELEHVAERIEVAYRQNRKCIKDPAARKTIRERIKEIRRWAKDPAQVPEWACISTAVYCDFPAAWRELQEVTEACQRSYDPDWPLRETPESARDLGLLPPELHTIPLTPGKAPPPPDEDLDLPWERPAANPARLKRRLLR